MATGERRQREIEKMRELILSAAEEIISAEGFEKLSIRKIAQKIEYSPAIIYHYFADKEEIVHFLMQKGYSKILSAVSFSKAECHSPEERLSETTRNYIKAALDMPDEFMAAQLNRSEINLKYTSSLYKGASKDKPALSVLCKCLQDIYKSQDNNQNHEIEESTIELTAQMIVVSTFGLIIKLIIEKDIGEEQREALINHFSDITVLRIAKQIL